MLGYVCFGALPCFLALQAVPGLSHVLPTPGQESPTSLSSLGSISWRMVLRHKVRALGMKKFLLHEHQDDQSY